MKTFFKYLFLLICILRCPQIFAQVAINTTGATANANAMLDISSNSKGVLLPRLNSAQRIAIPSPKTGLMVFDSTTASFWFYQTNAWREISTGSTSSDSSFIYGQTTGTISSYNMTNGATYTTISGFLYDSGGPSGNYSNNENSSVLITPVNTPNANGLIRIQVLTNNLENPYDSLFITDGPDSYVFTGTQTGSFNLILNPSVQVRFKSNAVNTAPGFQIRWDILIFPPATPDAPPASAGWYYIPQKVAVAGGLNVANNWSKDTAGYYSLSWGIDNKVKGVGAMAIGGLNSVTGNYSAAFGASNRVSGYGAAALNIGNTVTGDYAVALGSYNIAAGYESLATGSGTKTVGDVSTAFGSQTVANGDYSATFGSQTYANGQNSIATGTNTTAGGINSFTVGDVTQATNDNAAAFGSASTASGIGSFATGHSTQAIGNYSFAGGSFSQATNVNSFATGNSSIASAQNSFASGTGSQASGDNSAALNNNSVASGISSIATGHSTQANGDYSLAGGEFTTAGGDYSVALGSTSVAAGTISFAFGDGAKTESLSTHAVSMGYQTDAGGVSADAFGYRTKAIADHSTTFGYFSVARGWAGTVIGMFNDSLLTSSQLTPVATTPLFIVGNGDNTNIRSNAMVVQKNGFTGIGNILPQQNLSVAAGMDIDQSSANNGTIANTLTFGGGSGEGIGSKRTAGGNNNGLDLYTANAARMSIMNNGNVGIGVTTTSQKLEVNGNAAVDGNLTVGASNFGIIRNSNSTQMKLVSTNVIVNPAGGIAAGATINIPVTFSQTFSAPPLVYIGSCNGSGGWAEAVMTTTAAGTTGCILWIFNPRGVAVSPNFTVSIIAIGAP